MTEKQAYAHLFNIDLNAPEIRKLWGRLCADIVSVGVVKAVERLEREINSQIKLSKQ